jgi:hypothetical protein
MGIPGLLANIEPYATRSTPAGLDGYAVVIDGPALAYFAHKLAAEFNKSRIPCYADINALAIRWLKSLENNNFKV